MTKLVNQYGAKNAGFGDVSNMGMVELGSIGVVVEVVRVADCFGCEALCHGCCLALKLAV